MVRPGWPWIGHDLRGAFSRGVLSLVCGVQVVQDVRIAKHGPGTWRLEKMYTVDDDAQLQCDPTSDGSRLPEAKLLAGFDRNARWLYRVRVVGDSAYSIAKEADKREIDVYNGIKEAERLLSLTTYAWG